jgi:hypothetical protein
MKRSPFVVAAGIVAALLAGCGGGGDSGGSMPPPSTAATVVVSLTDAPACGFDAVNVTVSKVRIHASGSASDTDSGWTDITINPAKKLNLLNLSNGVLETLGQASLAPGHYSQLRLVLDSAAGASTVVATGSTTESALDTPSGLASGIKLVHEFDVAAGQRADVVMDFDACKSIVSKGNGRFLLKPVLKVLPSTLNGITGFISPNTLTNHMMVSAQQGGAIIASTTPNPSTGEFTLARLQTGNYNVVITGDDKAATVVGTVPVPTASTMVQLSTQAAPLVLQASASGTISGKVTLQPASSTEPPYVMASQTIAGGPSFALNYVAGDLDTGAYSLGKLPRAAPQYVVYSSVLPLKFNAATVTPGNGKYVLDAFANGYVGKNNPSVDINSGDQTAINVTLTP